MTLCMAPGALRVGVVVAWEAGEVLRRTPLAWLGAALSS